MSRVRNLSVLACFRPKEERENEGNPCEESVSCRVAILYFVSQSVSSANKAACCPLLLTRRALSEGRIAALVVDGGCGAHGHTRRDTFRGGGGVLPTRPVQSSAARAKRRSEVRKITVDIREGLRIRRSPQNAEPISWRPRFPRRAELYSYFIIVYAPRLSFAQSRVHPLARFHELVFIREIPL